jgi:hypothetical protein
VRKLAEFSKEEASSRNKQKLLSKRPRGIKTDEDKGNNHLVVQGFRASDKTRVSGKEASGIY